MNKQITNAWVAVGDEANWERGFENGIWGLQPQLENHWKRLQSGDLILFYCKAPVKGFVGAGLLRSKFRQTTPYWKEEITQNRVIWPFRFEFDVTHLLPLGGWWSQSISNNNFNLAILAGLNPVADREKAFKVLENLQFTVLKPAKPEAKIASTILEIGKIQRMIVEAGFPVNDESLDVIWKRTIRSVPTFAFSVNLSNDFDRSIKPLKHSFDVWNSRPFLITDESNIKYVRECANELYHEFSETLNILTVRQINELYDSKRHYYDLEEEYGLR